MGTVPNRVTPCFATISTRGAFARAAGLLALTLSLSNSVVAQGWEITPSVSVAEFYTTNVELRREEAADDEFITEVAPSLSVTKDGDRLSGSLDYLFQGYAYAKESDRNQSFHQLDAQFTLVPVRELLFVDAGATYSQVIIDPSLATGFSTLNLNNNLSDALTLSLNPRFIYQVGSFMEMNLDYAVESIDYRDENSTGNRLEDLTRQLSSVSFGTPKERDRFGWSADYNYERIDYDLSPELEIESASLGLRYLVGGRVNLFATGGVETDLTDSTSTGGLDSPTWTAGVGVPSRAGNFQVSVGERYFGKTFSLEWNRSLKLLELSASYDEGPTTTAERVLDNPIQFDGTRPPGGINRITPDVFLSKRGDIEIGLNLSRTDLDLRVYDDRRETEGVQDTRVQGILLNVLRSLGRRSRVFGDLGFQDEENLALDTDSFVASDVTFYSIGAGTDVGRAGTLDLTYRYFERDPTDLTPGQTITEEIVEFRFRMSF